MFLVEKAELIVEVGFERPDFALLQDPSTLLQHLFRRLEPHGLKLGDLRVERGAGNVADFHVLCYLFNYWMTVRVRVERVEVVCAELPADHVERFKVVTTDVLRALKDRSPDLLFRAAVVAVSMHGKPEGQPSKEYVAQFVTNIPKDLGPLTGCGSVLYFGPDGDRVLSVVTVDMSAAVADSLYVRVHAVWDAKRVPVEDLSALADDYVRHVVERLGLRLPL
jgi:hypothetical protein